MLIGKDYSAFSLDTIDHGTLGNHVRSDGRRQELPWPSSYAFSSRFC
jgi:hypothetical protein